MTLPNTITFLNNYFDFAARVRVESAHLYLRSMQRSKDLQRQKVAMVRIVEELIAESEDLCMWLVVIRDRERPPVPGLDFRKHFLSLQLEEGEVQRILEGLANVDDAESFRKALNLPDVSLLAEAMHETVPATEKALGQVLRIVKSNLQTRTAAGGMAVFVQNKIKHGMAVEDLGDDLRVVDFYIKGLKGKNPQAQTEQARNFRPTLSEAKGYVVTIQATAGAVLQLVLICKTLFVCDLLLKKRNGKKLSAQDWQIINDLRTNRKI